MILIFKGGPKVPKSIASGVPILSNITCTCAWFRIQVCFPVVPILQQLVLVSEYLLPCEGGVVLRDELLDHMMATGVDTSDTATWGPACNRAVRETFQHSQAHRKGKFKKYPFCQDIRWGSCQEILIMGDFPNFSWMSLVGYAH